MQDNNKFIYFIFRKRSNSRVIIINKDSENQLKKPKTKDGLILHFTCMSTRVDTQDDLY